MANIKVNLPPLPNYNLKISITLSEWLQKLYARVGQGPFLIQGYSLANLPDATKWGKRGTTNPFTSLIYIQDAPTGGGGGAGDGGCVAYSDGTVWRYMYNRLPV